MKLRTLFTTSDVMDVLGTNTEIALIADSKPKAVSNWRTQQTFPARTYVAITKALEAKGYRAPPSLWGMAMPDSFTEQENAFSHENA